MHASHQANPPDALPQELARAFTGPIQPVWSSPVYLVGLTLVTFLMLLLPGVYLALTGLVGWGLFYHATQHLAIFESMPSARGRVLIWIMLMKLLLYLGPLIVGVVLLVFMLKPLFARSARPDRHISFVPENEPVLFAFVERLCEVTGAPLPRRIDVNCDLNASAGFRRGMLSMIGGDFVLTIGAPLVAGLTIQQFVGVLAHEFGHFTQGAGTRLSYIIGRINNWFARVVYERDTWDQHLVELSQSETWYFSLVFLLARLFVGLTRRILWLLMMIGHIVSCGLSRQMEYDADRYAARVAGSDNFESETRRIRLLLFAWEAAHAELSRSWQERRLPDNLPALVVATADSFPPEVHERVGQAVGDPTTGLFATHPSDAARIRQAHKENAPGVFHASDPSSVLFRDFETVCKEISFAYYLDLISPRLTRDILIPTPKTTVLRDQRRERQSVASRYFPRKLTITHPLAVDRYSATFDLPAKACVAKLKQARIAIQKAGPAIRRACRQSAEAERRMVATRQAGVLIKAKVKVSPKQFGLAKANITEADQRHHQARHDRDTAMTILVKVDSVIALRLESALALLSHQPVAERIPHADRLRVRSQLLLETLTCITHAHHTIDALRFNLPALTALGDAYVQRQSDQVIISHLLRLISQQRQALSELRALLRENPYPFHHANGDLNLASFAIGVVPCQDDLTGMIDTSGRALENLSHVYVQAASELALMAERIETAIGLEPLPNPTNQPAE